MYGAKFLVVLNLLRNKAYKSLNNLFLFIQPTA